MVWMRLVRLCLGRLLNRRINIRIMCNEYYSLKNILNFSILRISERAGFERQISKNESAKMLDAG